MRPHPHRSLGVLASCPSLPAYPHRLGERPQPWGPRRAAPPQAGPNPGQAARPNLPPCTPPFPGFSALKSSLSPLSAGILSQRMFVMLPCGGVGVSAQSPLWLVLDGVVPFFCPQRGPPRGLEWRGSSRSFGAAKVGWPQVGAFHPWARCRCIRASPCPWDGLKHPTLERGSFMPLCSKGPRNQKPSRPFWGSRRERAGGAAGGSRKP